MTHGQQNRRIRCGQSLCLAAVVRSAREWPVVNGLGELMIRIDGKRRQSAPQEARGMRCSSSAVVVVSRPRGDWYRRSPLKLPAPSAPSEPLSMDGCKADWPRH